MGDRVLVDCGYSTYRAGVVEDVMDLGIGVVLDGSDGSIWRTSARYLQVISA